MKGQAKTSILSRQNGNTALHCTARNSDFKIAETLIAYDPEIVVQPNENNVYPLDLARQFHNDTISDFLSDVLQRKYHVQPFEALYLNYYEAKNAEEKDELTRDVISLLCEKAQADDEYDEEEEEFQENI